MDPKKQIDKSQQKGEWAGCDPATLVSSLREGFYSIPETHRAAIEGPLEELASRFELQSRAALGASVAVPTTVT